jgi:hypothetical protein
MEPLTGTKAKSEAYFDWQDVTDDSLPVKYILQISDNATFAQESIVLEVTGIEQSEYTLTPEQKLESVKQEAPYYWRVRVLDGASNESQWTEAGTFYVGFSFTFPDWLKYVLAGIVAIGMYFIGFWRGKVSSGML